MHRQSDCQTHHRGNQGGPPRPPLSFADPPPREGCNGDAGGGNETSGGDVQMIDVVDHRRVKGVELFFGYAVQGLDAKLKTSTGETADKKNDGIPDKTQRRDHHQSGTCTNGGIILCHVVFSFLLLFLKTHSGIFRLTRLRCAYACGWHRCAEKGGPSRPERT